MIHIRKNHPLQHLNTFGIPVFADAFINLSTEEDIQELMHHPVFHENRHLILGGGSNMLFTENFRGLVIQPSLSGIGITGEDDREVLVRVGAGVVWDDFVAWAVKKDYGGIENLSAIPGSVGAAPIQNIGAYGVEVQEVIEKVEGYHLATQTRQQFTRSECAFGYRNSYFKAALKNKFLVSHVYFRLKKGPHQLITHYGTIEQELGTTGHSPAALREVVTRIRTAKLPDITETGNAGSFFKNPVIDVTKADELKEQYSEIPFYPAEKDRVKLSAAWLIDQAGLKGFVLGKAATHTRQPLVLVNLGGACGKDILELACLIQEKVEATFGIFLEPEVNIY